MPPQRNLRFHRFAQRSAHRQSTHGGCVVNDCRDVRTALHRADELMYEDKKAYYERFPKKK